MPAEAAQSGQSPELLKASAPIPPTPKTAEPPLSQIAPPGSAIYLVKRGDTVTLVARRYLAQTSYLTSSELAEAM